jgi:hypothetical protein
MKNLVLIILGPLVLFIFPEISQANRPDNGTDDNQLILGEWIRHGPGGSFSLNFKSDGIVEGDFGMDQSIDIRSEFTLENGTIRFNDLEGVACPEPGEYKVDLNEY